MAPRFVLLERGVRFVVGAGGYGSSGDIEGSTSGANKEAAAIGDPEISMEAILQTMKPDPDVSNPPEISHLYMERRMKGDGLPGGIISSTDKALVVLYAGFYQPGDHSSGCYLVYDASSNSVSSIPQLPDPHSYSGIGPGAVILSRGEGRYLLAELVKTGSEFPVAALFLWECPNRNQGQWIRKAVCLPPRVFTDADYDYKIDMAFSYAGSSVCWVDLLQGVLICNLLKPTKPEFTFIPLPTGYSIDIPEDEPRPRPKQFRTMGCVNGVIKFVTVAGCYENWSISNVMLRTWTLTPDLKWEAGPFLALPDLWVSDSFRGSCLPRIVPCYPVISMDEDEILYVVLSEVDRVDALDIYGRVSGVEIVPKAHHVLRLDMIRQEVLQCSKIIPDNTTPGFPNLLGSKFTEFLQSSKGEG
ncbi:unnamed protein product [Urochloa humidicola]